ncbi:MAG: S9 family peptidase, partial [Actinobacteria bacterium]|nr:S9 family peptidase [Actinomycetota bacterium]
VLDVNHRGSTGYGRAFRDALRGQWGVADIADIAAGVTALVERGLVDGARVAIRGGSAGGYAVLRALTATDVFAAGTSRYGIADLALLAGDTHKFESRYVDGLVGPWPEAADTYRERSPLYHLDRLHAPVLLLQGEDDAVVPPNQAHQMAEAIRRAGGEVELVLYPGEGHGFRRAETTRDALARELAFYGRVFGFTPA